MSQIGILSGITADPGADFRVSLPRNLVPVPGSNGISNGYLRTAEGISRFDTGNDITGVGRGGINWKGTLYRVLGSKLVSIDYAGVVTVIGEVGDDGKPVSLTYSFDRLGIASAGRHLCSRTEQGLRNFRSRHSRRGIIRTRPACWPPAAHIARESGRRLCRFPRIG